MKVYEAQVVSVIMYNASCWAATSVVLSKLYVCHRKHLRAILNVRWPSIMSNKTLYERCNTRPLSERVALVRWKMLGHVLRSPENSPAQSALWFVVDYMKILPGRRGRHRMNLFKVIRDDLLFRGFNINCYEDVLNMREIAGDRSKWRKLFTDF